MRFRFLHAIVFLSCLISFLPRAKADDWPQWLGPNRDGVWHESNIIEKFPDGGPTLRWATNIGSGYSAPSVANGRVIVLDRISKGDKSSAKFLHDKDSIPKNHNFVRQLMPGKERVLCLNEADGKIQWAHEYDCPYSTVSAYAIGPRAAATMAEDFVYTLGAEGHLFCLNLQNGDVVWEKNFHTDFKVPVPNWGFSAPPLVDGDRLICIVGGEGSTVVAFDRRTGRELWRSLSAKEPGYSAPVIRDVGGHRELLIWDSDALHGLDPETGREFWSVKFESTFAMSVATPQVVDRRIFIMCFAGKSALVEVADDHRSAKIVWEGNRKRGIDGVHNTAQLVDKYIYGCANGGRFVCAKMDSGERVWSSFEPSSAKRPIHWGNVFTIRQADRFFLANDHGELIIANLSPAGYSEISRAKLIEPTHEVGPRTLVWSHPAFANRSVYLRNDKEIRCYSLAK